MGFQRCYNGVRLLDGAGPSALNIERLDRGALPLIHKMATNGLLVDLEHFSRLDKTLTQDMEILTEDVRSMTGHYINLGSGDQVAHLLFKVLGLKQAHPKLTKSGDRESVEDEVLTAIQHDHPVVPKCLEYKELEKLRGTYVRPMPRLARRVGFGEYRMFPNFRTTRVPSGRLSCADPNLLAMPTRTSRGKDIRKGFITRSGWVYVSVDESQIEMRIGAHRSKDPNLIRIYMQKEDIYSDFATKAFRLQDKRYKDPTGKWIYPTVHPMDHRYPAKTCILASMYRVTAAGLLMQMPVICAGCGLTSSKHTCSKFTPYWTENKCQDLINSFYITYGGLTKMQKSDDQIVMRNALIWDMWGRILHVTAARSVLQWVVSAALREAGNFGLQCLSKNSLVVQRGQGLVHLGSLIGQEATLWDGQDWSTGVVVASGLKDELCITLFDGLEIRCSPDHLIRVTNPKGYRHWMKAGDLRLGYRNTRVCISNGIGEWKWNTFPPTANVWPQDSNTPNLTWCEDNPELFGEMLGRITSDGSVISSSRVNKEGDYSPKVTYMLVAEHEKEILPRLEMAASLTVDRWRTTIQQKAGYAPLYRIEMYSRGLAELLLDWQIKDRIPQFIWNDSTILKAYLRGVFDGDGGISAFNSLAGRSVVLTFGSGFRKIALAKDIQLALLMLGIRSRLRCYEKSIRLSIQRTSLPNFICKIGFINSRKKDQLMTLPMSTRDAAYGEAVAVKDIQTTGTSSMVDFVDSTTGRFCADGIVVHNSGAQGTIKLTMAAINDDLEQGNLLEVIEPALQVHDELLFCCREDMAEELIELTKYRFETCVRLDVPIKASGVSAENWGSLEK